jgi:hypothetical protein
MLRQYKVVADGAALRRARWNKVARSVFLALACFAVLAAVRPAALASLQEAKPTSQKLAAAVVEESGSPVSGRDVGGLALLAGVALVGGTLALARVVWAVRARHAHAGVRTVLAGRAGPAASGGRVRVFVAPPRARARKLRRVRRRVRKLVWTEDIRWFVLGCVLATGLGALIAHMV